MPRAQRRDPDRLLPVDPTLRAIARDLYDAVADLPILSPHGHVPAAMLAQDEPFADPTSLLVVGDHYLTRLLHADGADPRLIGMAGAVEDPRATWREVASRFHLFAGTATGYWIEEALDGVLGIDEPLTAGSADGIYDEIAAALTTPAFRPRALLQRFGIEVLATTDDPLDDLDAHALLRSEGLRVTPTFRPDVYLDADGAAFVERAQALLAHTSQPATFTGYLDALRERRAHFVDHGAFSADHGVLEPFTVDLDPAEADRLLQRALAGRSDAAENRLLRGHLLLQMAGMSVEDGLVMTVHAGVHRGHSSATLAAFGPDTGHDIPVPTTFVDGLRPLLERYGLEPNLHLALFTVDETTFSREIAPLAGFYPSVFVGAPWWFLDAPDAIARFRSAVTETAGFYRGTGFIDDTRAFLSIPARHDTARRADAAFLARLVGEGRVSRATAERVAVDLVDAIPRRAFKL